MDKPNGAACAFKDVHGGYNVELVGQCSVKPEMLGVCKEEKTTVLDRATPFKAFDNSPDVPRLTNATELDSCDVAWAGFPCTDKNGKPSRCGESKCSLQPLPCPEGSTELQECGPQGEGVCAEFNGSKELLCVNPTILAASINYDVCEGKAKGEECQNVAIMTVDGRATVYETANGKCARHVCVPARIVACKSKQVAAPCSYWAIAKGETLQFDGVCKREPGISRRDLPAMDAAALDTVGLELKQQAHHAPKSLKHKSKNKRPSPTSGASTHGVGGGKSDAKAVDPMLHHPLHPLNATSSNASACGSGAACHHHHHHHHRSNGKAGRVVGGGGHSGVDRKGSASEGGAVNDEERLREILAGKIAELEVGGVENLETPIDLSGIYQDESVAAKMIEEMQGVTSNEELAADEKSSRLAAQLKKASENIALLQKKVSEINARCIVLKQSKQAVGAELTKVSASKAKLEQLCRELQKQNKLIVQSESRRIADEEDAKRHELSAQFQKTIEEVSAKMEQQAKDYVASLKENESLQQKLKTFLEQYAAREEHFSRQLEAKDLTVQLAEAKLERQIELTTRESDKVKLMMEKAKEFAEREIQLQTQLNAYSEKFDVVQETLTKSNEMFTTFRAEMDKMAKHTKKLEKENAALKKKCDEYDRGAIAALQEKVKGAEETVKLQERIKKLESLCRQLQAERKKETAESA
ncbi:hypothetical protein ATCC90586_000791 [Pythium insidiosum]|nr:hypothetical protein ATCC90586_000791 [Pythium insidiosum]